jgi:hypothetical protein
MQKYVFNKLALLEFAIARIARISSQLMNNIFLVHFSCVSKQKFSGQVFLHPETFHNLAHTTLSRKIRNKICR